MDSAGSSHVSFFFLVPVSFVLALSGRRGDAPWRVPEVDSVSSVCSALRRACSSSEPLHRRRQRDARQRGGTGGAVPLGSPQGSVAGRASGPCVAVVPWL